MTTAPSLSKIVEDVKSEFLVTDEDMVTLAQAFVKQAEEGLSEDSSRGLPMIPTFVTRIPTGKEKGLFLASDLGGSNFRVCAVQLHGDSTHEIHQMKWKVPHEKMNGKASDFWAFLASCAEEFMESHLPEVKNCSKESGRLSMGFTFSFPIHQTALNRGALIRWTKGYAINDAVGTDVCLAYQEALDTLGLNVNVVALVNDTTGCLLARAYATGSDSQTLMGQILGTGTNAAYSEKISHITKLDSRYSVVPAHSKIMVINTEWGSFDNDLTVLPNTRFDKAINLDTPNPDFHMFEKRVSGMFLGEISRRVLEELVKKGFIFQKCAPSIAANAPLYVPWSTDTSFLSLIAADDSKELEVVIEQIGELGILDSTREERQVVREICHAVALRSVRLVAAVTAGLFAKTRAFEKFDVVDIGADGAVFEFYPNFNKMFHDALRSIPAVGDKADRVTLGISKDGSGIGAALCAALATLE